MAWPFSKKKKGPKTVNIFLGFFFMVNFCLGTGFLGVPYSFLSAGYIAAIPTLLLVAFVSWNNSEWELETMARAQALVSWRKRSGEWKKAVSESDSERETLIEENEGASPNYEIRLTRKFEPTELCELFLTKWGKYAYMLVLSLYCFLTGWSFTTVAGSAWATNIPFDSETIQQCISSDFNGTFHPSSAPCWHAYQLCVFFYAVIVVPLSLVDLKEQAILQMVLGILRFLTIGSIVLYCIVKLSTNTQSCYQSISKNSTLSIINFLENASNQSQSVHFSEIVFRFDWRGWLLSIPVFTYAFIIHQGIPALTHPIRQKHQLRQFMMVMFSSACLCYLALGVVVPLWFNSVTHETVTLNWVNIARSSDENWAVRALSYYLVLFPSIDVVSAYPLVVHTISNNIYTVLFGKDTSHKPKHPRRDWAIQLLIKLVSSTLPIAAALFISNLISVLKYAGIMGFFICFFFPTSLQLRSMWVCSYQFSQTPALVTNGSDTENGSLSGKGEKKVVYSLQSGVDMNCGREAGKASFMSSCPTYMTPYSNRLLSHPAVVVGIGVVGIIMFLLAVSSVAVHHGKPECI